MNLLYQAVVAAIGAVVFVNGWTDAPTAIATCVASGAMSERRAAVMAAVCNLFGIVVACAVSPVVAMTVRDMIDLPTGQTRQTLCLVLCAMLGVWAWALFALWWGIPTSESHGLLAGLTGAAWACGYGVSAAAWARVGIGLGLCLFGGLLAGFLCGVAISCRVSQSAHLISKENMKRWLCLGAAAMATMHGAQDGQKFLGMWLLVASLGASSRELPLPMLIFLCAMLMGAGTLVGGGRIIRTLGEEMLDVDVRTGVAADFGGALCLLLLTIAGLPVSTTHAKTAALMGVGASESGRLNRKIVWRMLLLWLLTFPACGGISYALMKLMLCLGGDG